LSRVYFTDRDLGKQFPAILAAAGLQVERHHDLFPPAGSDEQWLEYCGTHGRIAIIRDERLWLGEGNLFDYRFIKCRHAIMRLRSLTH
jgi:PIN like domain